MMLMLTQVGYAGSLNNAQNTSSQVSDELVKGLVVDNFGHPLGGVKIYIKGKKSTACTSNQLGTFALDAEIHNTLIFELPGYLVIEKRVNAKRSLNVVLYDVYLKKTNVQSVIYDTISHEKMLGASSTVNSNQLNTTPASLYLAAMQGRMAGLRIEQKSGFRNPSITDNLKYDFIGGIPVSGSAESTDNNEFGILLRGQAPVTLIDGVQRDIYSLDPENIESITVLKDATSTLLLGQRSSRGAISVITKRAQAGKPRISFTAQRGVQNSQGLQKPIDTYRYVNLLNEAYYNSGSTSALYSDKALDKYKTNSDPIRYPSVDWQKTILRDNAPLNRYNLSINGGNQTAKYSVSLNYTDQDGMFVTADTNNYNTNLKLERYLINADLSVDVTKKLNVSLQLFGRLQKGNQPGAGAMQIVKDLLSTPSNAYAAQNPNGSFGGNNTWKNNLLAKTVGSGYIEDNSKDIMANINLGYDLNDYVKGLTAKIQANLSVQSQSSINRSKQSTVYQLSGDSSTYAMYGESISQKNDYASVVSTRYWFSQFQLRYDRQFGDHGVNAMLVADQRVVTLNYDIPGQSNNYSAKGSYNFKGKYFAEAGINYSGYNRYKPGHQYGLFYAGALGWELSKENFIKDNFDWINKLKVRTSFGRTGSGLDNSGYYIWRQAYGNPDNPYSTVVYMGGTSHNYLNGFREFSLANVNVTWEKANKLDLGFDASLFGDHLSVTGDVYNDLYFDLLQLRGKTIELIGNTYNNENIGKNRYQGAELSVSYQNNIRDFNYFISANASLEQSKVIYSDEQYKPKDYLKATGKPVGTLFGYISEGFIQTEEEAIAAPVVSGYTAKPGDIKYKDMNDDHVIDRFDLSPISSQKPLFYYGITVGFGYKNFDFSALLQGVENRTRYICNDVVDKAVINQNNQAYEQVLNRWTPETAATATSPRLAWGNNTSNYATNSFWIRSGDYFRLKNISLGYNLPYSWFHSIGLSGVKVFANAQNVFTRAEYNKIDPEVAVDAYPLQKVVNMGINIRL